MNKLAIFLLLAFAMSFANAQDHYEDQEMQTVFSGYRSNGGYGAFSIGYATIDGRDAITSGMRGGFIFDHVLAVGLGGYGFVNNLNYNNLSINEFSLAGGYGGVFIEPILSWNKPVHISLPVLFGIGGVAAFEDGEWGFWDHHYSPVDIGHEVFFVIEPAVELEFNLARFFRMAFAASYRHTSKLELPEISPDALRGMNYSLTFKFGKF